MDVLRQLIETVAGEVKFEIIANIEPCHGLIAHDVMRCNIV